MWIMLTDSTLNQNLHCLNIERNEVGERTGQKLII